LLSSDLQIKFKKGDRFMKGRELNAKRAIAMAVTGLLLLLLSFSGNSVGQLQSAYENDTVKSSNELVGDEPGAAILSEPSGIITTGRPTYVWSEVAGTEFYCLVVEDNWGDVVVNLCYDASDLVLNEESKLSVTPPVTLMAGSYSWRIRTCNCGEKQWSDPMSFTVCTSTTLPGKATLISPKNTIGTSTPTFNWNCVAGATRYRLKVASVSDLSHPVITDWYDASDVASQRGCSVTLDGTLDPGNYRWWVQTGNCVGDGPWSNYLSFKITSEVPGKITTISPRGLISTRKPNFIWGALSTATEYHLQVQNDAEIVLDEWYPAEDITSGSRCTVPSPSILSDDDIDYYWRVQASNDAGPGPWSSMKYFEVVCGKAQGGAR
jgi:hypothetical protein